MELSTTQGATSCVDTREIPSILRNPRVYSIHERSQPVLVQCHTNAVNIYVYIIDLIKKKRGGRR
jgi:hypothetical protein